MRRNIINYVREKYNTTPEYLWANTPNIFVLRHKKNKKWYAIVMDIKKSKIVPDNNTYNADKKIDIMNIKLDPVMIDLLVDHRNFFRAYHMNKIHWLSIILDGPVSKEKIYDLIDISYDITK